MLFRSIVLALLQNVATAPFLFQRMMIRFVQPFFLTGIITLYMAVVTNSTSIAVTCVIIVVAVGLLVAKHYKNRNQKSASDRPITPVRSDSKQVPDNAQSDFPDKNMHLPADHIDVNIEMRASPAKDAADSDGSSNSLASEKEAFGGETLVKTN